MKAWVGGGALFGCLLFLVSCFPEGKEGFDKLAPAFGNVPRDFSKATTGLFWSIYEEDLLTHRFKRVTAIGKVPDKMIPDGQGQYSAAVAVLKQEETSDGPLSDTYIPVVVRVVRQGDRFRFLPTDILTDQGSLSGWHDVWNRTVHFRGLYNTEKNGKLLNIIWEFYGRY